MVDAVPPPPDLALPEQPRTQVDGAVFNRPARVGIASGLESLGQGTEQLVDTAAKAQAQSDLKAATLDANGVPQVATGLNSVMLGQAGKDYNDAILQGTKAAATSQISAAVTDIHQRYPNDAEAFATAVKAKAAAYQSMYPGALGNSLADLTNNLGSQHYSNIVENDIRLQTQTSLQAITTNIDDTNNQLRILARQGANDTPQYRLLQAQLSDAYDDLGSNKSFGYSQDKIDSEKDHAFDMLNGEFVVGRVDETFNKKGKAAAQQILDDQIRNNSNLDLSESERNQLYAQGMAHLSYLSGEQSAQIAAMKPRVDDTTRILASGNDPQSAEHLTDAQIDATIAQAQSIGDIKGAEALQAARVAAYRDVAFRGLSPDQKATTLLGASAAGVGGPIASGVNSEQGAVQFFVSKGWTPAQAAGIVGNLVHESGGRLNPGAVNPGDGSDGSDSIGIGQWNSTRAAALKQFAASQGKPVTDFSTQLAFVQHELETTEGPAAQRLRGAQNVQDATSAFALGYERPQGFQTGDLSQVAGGRNRLDQANRIAASGGNTSGITTVGPKYTPAEDQANPYVADAFMRQNAIAAKDEIRVAKSLADTVDNSVKYSGQVTPDIVPTAATVYQIAQRHPAELGETADRVRGTLTGQPQGFTAAGAPDGGVGFEAQARQMAAGPDRLQMQVAQAQLRGIEQGRKLLTDNAPQYALQEHWITKRPATLNLTPQTQQDGTLPPGVAPVQQQLADRAQTAIIIGDRTRNAFQPAFTPGELDQVKSLATNGTLDQRTAFLGALTHAGMTQPVLQATLKQLASAPETQAMAVAGAVAPDNPDAARGILQGQALLQGEPKFAPSAGDVQAAFAKAYPPNDFPVPTQRDVFLKAANAYYASQSAAANDTSGKLNQDRFDASMKAVTGGLISYRGSTVNAPWYGASDAQFHAAIQSLTPTDMAGAVTSTGAPFPVAQLQVRTLMTGAPWRLQSAGGEGQYLVFSGDDAARSYLRSANGGPFVLDLSSKKSIQPGMTPIVLPPNLTLPPKPNDRPDPYGQPGKSIPNTGLLQ